MIAAQGKNSPAKNRPPAITIFCISAKISRFAGIAQLVEQLIRNQQVVGSSPIPGSTFFL
jgi:hypothetical protein